MWFRLHCCEDEHDLVEIGKHGLLDDSFFCGACIFTDQCVSSTVRSLADESFAVTVVEDACAAGSETLHRRELEIINMIYCHVMSCEELLGYLP